MEYITMALIGTVFILMFVSLKGSKTRRKQMPKLSKTILGPPRVNTNEGNFPDIVQAGSLHHFLSNMHTKYGDVIQIWFGEKPVISTASPEAFKDQIKLFDKPAMKFIEPVFGNQGIQFVNGEEAKIRRQNYDAFLSQDYVLQYFHVFKDVVDSFVQKLKQLQDGSTVNVYDVMFHLSCKAVGITMFGDYFLDDDNVEKFKGLYSKFWPVLERNFTQGLPTEGTEERRYFEDVVNEVHNVARDLIASRKGRKDRKFIDVVMENGHDETTILGDILVYLVGGFHSTSITLTWCIYHASKYPATKKRLQEELSRVLEHSDVTPAALKEMRYLRSFINETLRLRFVAPVAIRKAGQDTVIGGYRIPNDVDIIQALSVVLTSKELWNDPYRFDPERFTAQRNISIRTNAKEKRSPLAFCPFGFAGRRKCPGQKFFFEEAMVFLSALFNNFEFTLLDDQDVTIMYGLLTRPEEDIFATLKVRQGK